MRRLPALIGACLAMLTMSLAGVAEIPALVRHPDITPDGRRTTAKAWARSLGFSTPRR